MSAAPAWAAAGLLGVSIVLASGRWGGGTPAAPPMRDAAWQDAPAPQAAQAGPPATPAVRCPGNGPGAAKPANRGA